MKFSDVIWVPLGEGHLSEFILKKYNLQLNHLYDIKNENMLFCFLYHFKNVDEKKLDTLLKKANEFLSFYNANDEMAFFFVITQSLISNVSDRSVKTHKINNCLYYYEFNTVNLWPAEKEGFYERIIDNDLIAVMMKEINIIISDKIMDTPENNNSILSEYEHFNIEMIEKLYDRISEQQIAFLSYIKENNKLLEKINKKIYDNQKELKQTKRFVEEVRWGIVFNNTITNSSWMHDKALSLSGWAIGYPCAYIIYKVLNIFKPKKILELGLGQSTKIISQYAETSENISHIVIEHDNQWIDFFRQEYTFSNATDIVQCDYKLDDFNGVSGVRQYDGLFEKISGKIFDFIFIDGPWAGDMEMFGRVDILGLLPECLDASFVLMLDDCNRDVEMKTFKMIITALENTNINFKTGRYSGIKDLRIICSADVGFLCTL
ncbi:MAG: hypothetical protein FWD82_06645 [Defluviitaleaceae bacterium]|nr:hypothetical protein [Defluviitaleaceae bacterium]